MINEHWNSQKCNYNLISIIWYIIINECTSTSDLVKALYNVCKWLLEKRYYEIWATVDFILFYLQTFIELFTAEQKRKQELKNNQKWNTVKPTRIYTVVSPVILGECEKGWPFCVVGLVGFAFQEVYHAEAVPGNKERTY